MSRLIFFQVGVFMSAFLLFSIQLITASRMLPLFGGSFMTWGTCLIFFQGLLLCGYAFAHWGLKTWGVKGYAKIHWLLIFAGLIGYPLQKLAPTSVALPPTAALLLMLTINTAVVYFALSTISVVMQRWLSASSLKQRNNPYLLYGSSNLGSMLGLLSYPFLVERFLSLDLQGEAWWIGYLILCAVLIPCSPRRVEEGGIAEDKKNPGRKASPLRWLGLSACGSALLLSTTNIITFDIASTPLLWVLPLAVYLLTFVLVFKSRSWFPNWIITLSHWLLPLALVLGWFGELHVVLSNVWVLVLIYLTILFVLCMCCHGILYRERPKDPNQLTRFYLYLSFGGVTGSIIVNWVIPFLSDRSIEYPFALLLAVFLIGYQRRDVFNKRALIHGLAYLLLMLVIFHIIGKAGLAPSSAFFTIGLLVMLPLVLVKNAPAHFRMFFSCAVLAFIVSPYLISNSVNVHYHRNFYGIYKIFDQGGKRHLMQGTTRHGTQYLVDSEKHYQPLAYYHHTTPSGRLLKDNPMGFKEIGMIGLGSGALGAYLKQGQAMTVYELDPDTIKIAETYFSFLDHGRENGAEFRFVIGDGRQALQSVEDATYDLFIVDAFSSDSIPVHLITVEALREYLRVITGEGVLLIHCSNRYLDVPGLIQANARAMNISFLHSENVGLANGDSLSSDWVAFSKSDSVVRSLRDTLDWRPYHSSNPLPPPWTDQFSSIVDLIK